jgi:hypothetical protein
MQLEHTNRQNTFLFSLSYRNIFKGAYEIPEKYIYIYDDLRYFSRGLVTNSIKLDNFIYKQVNIYKGSG